MGVAAAWIAFGAFGCALATRAVLSEWTWGSDRRPRTALRVLDAGTATAAVVLLALLTYQVVPVLLAR